MFNYHKIKTNFSLILILSIAIILIILAFFVLPKDIFKQLAQEKNTSCFSVEEKTVRGDSMSGIIEGGETIKILSGYYKCNEVERNDLIAYSYANGSSLLIKIIKGISGDKFGFQKTENGWHILLNNKVLKNSQNQPYILDERGYQMLTLYERDYKGIIPQNAYLLLGNLSIGSLDSTRFGLIGKTDILGKVEY